MAISDWKKFPELMVASLLLLSTLATGKDEPVKNAAHDLMKHAGRELNVLSVRNSTEYLVVANFHATRPHVSAHPEYTWRTGLSQRWPPSAAQTWCAVFPRHAFTKSPSSAMQSKESVSPVGPAHTRHKGLRFGSCFQPQLRKQWYRCDQMRRSIQLSSFLKSVRTWARF